MAFTLKLNNGTDSEYVFDYLPDIAINKNNKHDDANSLEYTEVSWGISGLLVPKSGTTIKDQVTALESLLAYGTLTYARLYSDTTIIEQIPNDIPIKIDSFELPTSAGPEYATKRTFSISLSGQDASSAITTNGKYEYTTQYSTDINNFVTKTISGTVEDLIGTNSKVKTEALIASEGFDTWTYNSIEALREKYDITNNKNDTICTFTIVHKSMVETLPTGVTDGRYAIQERQDAFGINYVTVSGVFYGTVSACNRAIAQVTAGKGTLLEDVQTREPIANSTSFTYNFIGITSKVLSKEEVISITPSIMQFVHYRVLGEAPVKQYTTWKPASATQRGSITHLTKVPSLPSPHWSNEHIINSNYTTYSAEYDRKFRQRVFKLDYTYEFEFNNTPVI
jgi:hypothetical protein